MKECPTCRRCYEDNSNFCPIDGVSLSFTITGSRLLGGKYRLERLIARGGMGAIYQALQEGLSRVVAVKVLNPELVNNTTAMERFRREALAIAGLKHPNIITIYDFGVTQAGSSYIAMEYLKGRSLSRVLEQEGKLKLDRLLTLIEPICHALTEAHSKGVIHRDLKPDNIMLEQVASTEVVKVVDFGLAKLKQHAEQRRITGSLVVGTFDYMSPEQCQSMDLEASSDIYSLGIVIYEMLTGVVPFHGSSRLATIYQHINDPPRPPRAHRAEIPDAVEKVMLKALSKDSGERQQSAEELLLEMSAAIKSAIRPSPTRSRSAIREATSRFNRVGDGRKNPNATLKKHLVFEHFLGRERELNRLTTEFAFIRSGRVKPIIVLGDAGMGKTQLITEFRRRLGDSSALFLNGRFFDYLGSTPYKPLLDALTAHLRQLINQPALFDAILGELAGRVRQDLENEWQLWNVRANSGSLQGGPEGEKYRIFEHLAQIYIKLARHQPIVLWMDDMQWADGLSLNFLSYLLRRTLGEPLQFIFTARTQDVTQKDHPFQQWQSLVATARNIEQFPLANLSTGEVDEYVRRVFNDIELPAGTVERLWQETQGNPYFLSEILRLLVEDDKIVWTGQKWRCDQLMEINLPSSIINIVDAHLRRFREPELDLFMQAAVLGEQFSFEILRIVTGLEEDKLIELVESGLAGYVFKELPISALRPSFTGADELYSFYHNTVRKVLYSKINTRRRRKLHQNVAQILEKEAIKAAQTGRKDRLDELIPLLAHHYYNGEQYQLAFKYSVEAASAAWRALAIDEAEDYLNRVQEMLIKMDEAKALEQQVEVDANAVITNKLLGISLAQYRILSGELHTARGRMDEAKASLSLGLQLSARLGEKEIMGRAVLATGELYHECGDQEQAIKYFQHAHEIYQRLGHHVGECQALNRMAWVNYEQAVFAQAAEYAYHCANLAQQCGDALAEARARLTLAATDYRTARYGNALLGGRVALEIAQTAGDRVLERQATTFLGATASATGIYNQALIWLDQALSIARDTGARRNEARILSELGEVYRRQGKFQESIDYFTRAYEISVEARAFHEQETALLGLGLVYQGLKYYEQAQTYLRQAMTISKEVGDPITIVEEKLALAELHILNKNFADAKMLLASALEIATRTGLRAHRWQILYKQALILKEEKSFDKALAAVNESVRIIKAIRNDIEDESMRKLFLSDKSMVLQLLNQLKT